MPKYSIFQAFVVSRKGGRSSLCMLAVISIFAIASYITLSCLGFRVSRSHLQRTIAGVATVTFKGVPPQPVSILCGGNYESQTNFQPCLCYVDVADNITGDEVVTLTDKDVRRVQGNITGVKCAMTFIEGGRMGNFMGEYATLYGLARTNRRPAFMTHAMASVLQRYFKVTIPVLDPKVYSQLKWDHKTVENWMQDSYRSMEGQFIRLHGFPYSFTFYDRWRDDIRREFTLHEEIQDRAQSVLRGLSANRTSVTFVGVHVRRTDYISRLSSFDGVVADKNFFVRATGHFRSRYPDAIFVVVSSDMKWCRENIANDRGDVFFVGNSNETDPIRDFAILVNCNHTIFTIGTYGYWAAYLAGGEVIYLANFTLPNSGFLKFWKPEATFLPHWVPIAADLNPLYNTSKQGRT